MEDKETGMNLYIEALNNLNLWVSRENPGP